MTMRTTAWQKAIKSAPDPRRAKQFFDQLSGTAAGPELKGASLEQARLFAALFSGSPVMSEGLARNPGWLEALQIDHLRHPRQEQGLRREVNGWLLPTLKERDFSGALARLRRFKQRE